MEWTKQEIEEAVNSAWEKSVGGSDDDTADFFVRGGNSLDATRLVMRITRILGVTIKPRTIFDNPVLMDFRATVVHAVSAQSWERNG
jgi:acyl carrier protein